MRDLLCPYVNDYTVTKNPIIQRGGNALKVNVFGSAVDNVCYAEGVTEKMRALGHTVQLIYTTREEALVMINTVVVNDKVIWQKNGKAKGF